MDKVLSVIMPAYNEAGHIHGILEKVCHVVLPFDFSMQLVVVNDGSKDNTTAVVKSFIEHHPDKDIILMEHTCNQGKGMAIRTGLTAVKGSYVVIQDGDEELDPNDFVKMLRTMCNLDLQVLYGSRFLGKDRKTYAYRSFYFGTRLLSVLTNILYSQHITDEPTCYKMFRSDLIKSIRLECHGFEFCPEITAKVGRRGLKIKEIPIHYYPRTMEEGKKIRYRDGLIAIWTLFKFRFVSRKMLFGNNNPPFQ